MRKMIAMIALFMMATGCIGMHYAPRKVERTVSDPETGSMTTTTEEGLVIETSRDLREREVEEAKAAAIREGKPLPNYQNERQCDALGLNCVERQAGGQAAVMQASQGGYGMMGVGMGMYGLGGPNMLSQFAIEREQAIHASETNKADLAGTSVPGRTAQQSALPANQQITIDLPPVNPQASSGSAASFGELESVKDELGQIKQDLDGIKQKDAIREEENRIILQGTMGSQE